MEEQILFEERRSSELSESLLLQAREELGETDEAREEGVKAIKEWIKTHKNDYTSFGKDHSRFQRINLKNTCN